MTERGKRKAEDEAQTDDDNTTVVAKRVVTLVKIPKEVPQSEWRVRVARYDYKSTAKLPACSPDGYINILIHVNDPLSPYRVRSEHGVILENAWQAAKLYPHVDAQRIAKHRMRPNDIIWQHPAEVHATYTPPLNDGTVPVGSVSNALQLHNLDVKPEYWQWRAKLESANYAVRYPNGYHGRHTCMGVLWPAQEGDLVATRHPQTNVPYTLLPYVEARKRVYCGLYAEICKKDAEFARLRSLLRSGKKIQIWEVDGPLIEWGRTEATFASLTPLKPGLDMHNIATVSKLLNDVKHSFGHGYTIAALLLHDEKWLQ